MPDYPARNAIKMKQMPTRQGPNSLTQHKLIQANRTLLLSLIFKYFIAQNITWIYFDFWSFAAEIIVEGYIRLHRVKRQILHSPQQNISLIT
jgi:hypothetical protein